APRWIRSKARGSCLDSSCLGTKSLQTSIVGGASPGELSARAHFERPDYVSQIRAPHGRAGLVRSFEPRRLVADLEIGRRRRAGPPKTWDGMETPHPSSFIPPSRQPPS